MEKTESTHRSSFNRSIGLRNSRSRRFANVAIAAIGVLSLAACTGRNSSRTAEVFHPVVGGISDSSIVSTRPQNLGTVMVLLEMKSPPLAATAKREGGKMIVDAGQVLQLQKESRDLETQLKAVSPDIRVVYRYRTLLNALAVVVPSEHLDAVGKLPGVLSIEKSQLWDRPAPMASAVALSASGNLKEFNSVKFIGADRAHAAGFAGQGKRIGVIDTGIDFTHAMFGGAGTKEAFEAVDPNVPNAGFPNAKVIGGMDFVGTSFDAGSEILSARIPRPDVNPIDEAEHGTHVAGTIAGIGDDTATYSGVAPEAKLLALKVFGKSGSTSDEVVIAALEYSADPNGNADLNSRLDVVNLSLGSSFGFSRILYTKAIRNLSSLGTSVVISAGNSGAVDFIVGSPGTADDAISVAASVDESEQNWKFRAVRFNSTNPAKSQLTEAVEGPVSRPIGSLVQDGQVSGKLVYIGLAAEDLDAETVAKVKGHVALIRRGQAPFVDKLKRASEAGAIGAVMMNNQPGQPFSMGGEGRVEIPAIMISQALGDALMLDMKAGDVSIDFVTAEKIERPELIDQITDFSSKGPRAFDGAFKPEIAAPGANIISAQAGTGKGGVQFSGTSMAAPHMAGVLALLHQKFDKLSANELKAVVMGSTKLLHTPDKKRLPLTLQGAGRVQVMEALNAKAVVTPASLSLGYMSLSDRKVIQRTVSIKNLSDKPLRLIPQLVEAAPGVELLSGSVSQQIQPTEVAVGATVNLEVRLRLDAKSVGASGGEIDGHIALLTADQQTIARVPFLAVVSLVSDVRVDQLQVQSSEDDAVGAVVDLSLTNRGKNAGSAQLFNFLGGSDRKVVSARRDTLSTACDLELAGYRIVEASTGNLLQIAVKTYQPVSTWILCEPSVLIRTSPESGDVFQQELAGMAAGTVKGVPAVPSVPFWSHLLDASMARSIRARFEQEVGEGSARPGSEDYSSALLALRPMYVADSSTVAVLEAPVAKLLPQSNNRLGIKIITSHYGSAGSEVDDSLQTIQKDWMEISVDAQDQGFVDLPSSSLQIGAGQKTNVSFTKGYGDHSLLLLATENAPSLSLQIKDKQSQVKQPRFLESTDRD